MGSAYSARHFNCKIVENGAGKSFRAKRNRANFGDNFYGVGNGLVCSSALPAAGSFNAGHGNVRSSVSAPAAGK